MGSAWREAGDVASIDIHNPEVSCDPERREEDRSYEPMFVYAIELVDDPEAVSVVPIRVTPR